MITVTRSSSRLTESATTPAVDPSHGMPKLPCMPAGQAIVRHRDVHRRASASLRWMRTPQRQIRAVWADHPELVIGDLRQGYPYWLVDEQGRRRVELRGEDLVVGDEHALSLNIPGIPHAGERWHIALWHSSEPFHHALMRGIAWWDVVGSGELRRPR